MKSRPLFAAPFGDEVAMRRRARSFLGTGAALRPEAECWKSAVARDGVDQATCLFYETLLASERHGALVRRIDGAPIEPMAPESGPSLVVVPGMFYREMPEIGADGGLLREVASRFKITSSVVATKSLGSVAQNVEILHRHLTALPTGPFWLASMSRGSAEVKMLLHKFAGAPYMPNLKAWISICGIVAGSPLLERTYANPLFAGVHGAFARLNGVSAGLARELLASNSHWQPTQCPPGTAVINVVAVPLSWHITHGAIRRYRRICHLGPTDGVVLLESYLAEPGGIYPLWGVDHFLRSARIPALFYRLLNHLLMQERGQNEQITAGPDLADQLGTVGDGSGRNGARTQNAAANNG